MNATRGMTNDGRPTSRSELGIRNPRFPVARRRGGCGSGRGRGGFTLIEVLATMVLLGIVLPVAMRGVSGALAAASSAKHTSEAATLAETKLNDLVITGDWAATATSGDFSPDHPEYKWSLESVARDFSATELVLTVKWVERGNEKATRMSTMVFESGLTTQ